MTSRLFVPGGYLIRRGTKTMAIKMAPAYGLPISIITFAGGKRWRVVGRVRVEPRKRKAKP